MLGKLIGTVVAAKAINSVAKAVRESAEEKEYEARERRRQEAEEIEREAAERRRKEAAENRRLMADAAEKEHRRRMVEAEAAEKRRRIEVAEKMGMIPVSRDCSEFCDEDHTNVVRYFLGMGFENIHLKELRDLKHRRFGRDLCGSVKTVSINGDDSFKKGDYFPPSAYVLISFHLYPDSPSVPIPELEEKKAERDRRAGIKSKKTCAYCDSYVVDENGFCPRCGAPLGRR